MALLEFSTALFNSIPSHMHLSACNNSNSSHKLEFLSLQEDGWPETKVRLGVALLKQVKKLRILSSIRDQRTKKAGNKGTAKSCETREAIPADI